MNPPRKSRIRLITALGAVVLLAVALTYTSFNAAAADVTAGELLRVPNRATAISWWAL